MLNIPGEGEGEGEGVRGEKVRVRVREEHYTLTPSPSPSHPHLLIAFHYVVFDLLTFQIFLNDLYNAYNNNEELLKY